MTDPMTYEDAKRRMLDGLRKAISRHETGDFTNFDCGDFDEIDAVLPRGEKGDSWSRLFLALYFWDGWIDCANHDWLYYEPIEKDDWPRLAREICAAIEEEREISDHVILDRFDLRKPGQ